MVEVQKESQTQICGERSIEHHHRDTGEVAAQHVEQRGKHVLKQRTARWRDQPHNAARNARSVGQKIEQQHPAKKEAEEPCNSGCGDEKQSAILLQEIA